MRKFAYVLCMLLLLPFSVNAASVIVYDGDQFDFDPANTYQLAGSLSASNPLVTYGVNVETGETFDFVVTAPEEFSVLAILTTGPYATGSGIVNPYGDFTIPAGTSYILPVSWLYFEGQTNWLTVGLGYSVIPGKTTLDIINDVYGGSLPVGPVFEGHIAQVPEPAALPLMLSGLAMVGYLAKRRKYKIAL